jgi:outer membrane protein assembly factor BamB
MGTKQFLTCLAALAWLGNAVPWPRAPWVDERLAAAADGDPTTLWRVPGEARGRPAGDRDTAFFLSKSHEVIAIDERSGTVRWRSSTGAGGPGTLGPGIVLAGPLVVAGDYDVVAFNRTDGEVRWRFAPSDGYGAGVYLGTARDGLVFTGSPSGHLYGIDQRTGKQRWSVQVESANTTVFAPVSDGHLVAAGYTTFVAPNLGGLVVVDAGTGRLRWRKAFPRSGDHPLLATNWAGGPVISRDFIAATSGDGVIHAFSRASGSDWWTIPALDNLDPDAATHDFRPLAVFRELLVAGSLTGEVVAYDIKTRGIRWRYSDPLDGAVMFHLIAGDGTVYVPYITGRLVALGLSDGKRRWRIGDGFTSPPFLSPKGTIVVGSDHGFFALQE